MKESFESVPFTLGADVANAATFDVSYPAGFTAGDFSGAAGHLCHINGQELRQPKHIQLSFGATKVTVTNNTGDTLKANSTGAFQFEIRGDKTDVQANVPGGKGRQNVQVIEGKVLLVDFGSPAATSTNGILAAKTASNAAAVYTVADFASLTAGILDVARNITLTGSGAGANHVITVKGLDAYGQLMQENITLVDGTTVQGLKAFASVYEFDVAAGAAGKTFSAGWGKKFGLPVRIKDVRQVRFEQIDDTLVECRDIRISFQHTEAEADAGAVRYLAPGHAGYLEYANVVPDDTVTTGGALTYAVSGVAVAGLAPTIANGAVAGSIASATPTNDGTEYFLSTDYISVTPAAALNASAPLNSVMSYHRTDGKLVLGLAKNTAATATNADVRGTWTPNANPDGTKSFCLHIQAAEIYDLGNDQYSG